MTFLLMLQSADVKYIDPSYIIRTVPTISNDRIYCKILAHNAVHAAFGGYTGITVVSTQNDQLHAVTAAVSCCALSVPSAQSPWMKPTIQKLMCSPMPGPCQHTLCVPADPNSHIGSKEDWYGCTVQLC